MKLTARQIRGLESLCLELATEAELERVAEYTTGEPHREARRLLLARCQELARRAARDLSAALARFPLP